MEKLRRLLKGNRGQSMVEFALVLPLLILLVFGIIEFGRIYNASLTVTAAAREGARAAIVATGSAQTAVNTAVNSFAASFPGTLLTPTLNPSRPVLGQPVTVTVRGQVTLITPLIRAFFADNSVYTVTGTCTMRN